MGWFVLRSIADSVKSISANGVQFIKAREGFSNTPYKDSAGKWTIGYGHLVRSGEWWDYISDMEADALLLSDLERFERAVNKGVTVPLTQSMYDALVSFAYNVGDGAFLNSTLLVKLNAGDYQGASEQLQRWKFAGGEVSSGLVARRELEARLFWS